MAILTWEQPTPYDKQSHNLQINVKNGMVARCGGPAWWKKSCDIYWSFIVGGGPKVLLMLLHLAYDIPYAINLANSLMLKRFTQYVDLFFLTFRQTDMVIKFCKTFGLY